MSTGILSSLGEIILRVIEYLGYPGIVLIIAAENIFPPIPSELVLPLAGFLASEGKLDPVLIIISSTLGALIGAYVLYFLGRKFKGSYFHKLLNNYGKYFLMKEDDLDKAEEWFKKHGPASVFFGRMVPLVRSLISIPAGYVKMPFWRFSLYTIAGSVIWNTISTYAGVILGANWEKFGGYIKEYEHIILFVIVLGLISFVWSRRTILMSVFRK